MAIQRNFNRKRGPLCQIVDIEQGAGGKQVNQKAIDFRIGVSLLSVTSIEHLMVTFLADMRVRSPSSSHRIFAALNKTERTYSPSIN